MTDRSNEFLLAADIGNSRTKFGLFAAGEWKPASPELPRCVDSWTVSHHDKIDWQGMQQSIAARGAKSVQGLVAGANPDGVAHLLSSWPKNGWPKPRVIDDPSDFPLEVRLQEPRKAGIDRLLNGVAANVLRPAGTPCVIVDTGTATTVDFVSSDGAFEGGAILPGFELSARALHQYTALLPYITIDELVEESHEPLGLNTREALRSGLFWGQVGAIRELISRLAGRCKIPPFVLITGGGAALAHPQLPGARWEPHLALQGLVIAASR